MLTPLETERLYMRPLEKGDVARLFLLDSNPEVMKYVGQPVLTNLVASEKVIAMIQQQYEDNGTGRFAVIEKESGLLIGWSGIKFITEEINNHNHFYEIGYRFLPEFWGKGYATESAKAFLKRGFDAMNLDKMYAYAHSENQASTYVLEKIGFSRKGSFEEHDGTCFWFEITKEEYTQQYAVQHVE